MRLLEGDSIVVRIISDVEANTGQPNSSLAIAINAIRSMPPSGHYKVINIYVDSATGKLVVQYDDQPQGE